jgi:hypothetical protein
LARSEQASNDLLADLRSDKGMKWVPNDMWLSYLRVNTPAKNLDYDLAVSTDGTRPSARMVGIGVPGGPHAPEDAGMPMWQATAIIGGVLAALTLGVAWQRRRPAASS